MKLPQDFKEFVQLLEKHKAQYLVVGGYAVGYYGHPRFTGDLDIWLSPTKENAEKVMLAIHDFGFDSLKIQIEDLTKLGNIIQLGYPPLRIDLLTEIDGVSFHTCYKNKQVARFDDLEVNFIGYQDLLANKKASGRYKDLDDMENLEKT